MSDLIVETLIPILSKHYSIKCPTSEVEALKKAAALLEEKMQKIAGDNNILSSDRIAVVAALNLAHQLFLHEAAHSSQIERLQQRLEDLQKKMENLSDGKCKTTFT